MARILVQELKCPGHCLPYAIDIAVALSGHDDEIHLVVNSRLRDRYATIVGEEGLPDGIEVHWVDGLEDLTWNSAATARLEIEHAESLITSIGARRVVLPTADSLARCLFMHAGARRLLRRTDVRFDLIVHGVAAATPSQFGVRLDKWFAHRCSIDWVSHANLLTPDPYAGLGPGRRFFTGRTRKALAYLPYVLPDFDTCSQEEARDRMQVPREGRLLVVPGVIDLRKAVRELLAALPALDGIIDGLLLAGPISSVLKADIEQARSRPGPRLHVVDKFLDQHHFEAALLAGDLVWAVYPKWKGLSSMQWLAGRYDRRCIVAGDHPSALFMNDHGRGCLALGDSIAASVHDAIEGPAPDEEYKHFIQLLSDKTAFDAVLNDGARFDSLAALDRFFAT